MNSSSVIWRAAALALLLIVPATASAQDSKSAVLAAELTALLDQRKLDSVAAKDADHFVGALYFPGSQLLVISARFSSPDRINYLLGQKAYRDVYVDLNGTPKQETKRFISDVGADGLRFQPDDDKPYDTVDVSGKSLKFDGEWDKADMSEDEYVKAFQTNDAKYSAMLAALIATLKKPS